MHHSATRYHWQHALAALCPSSAQVRGRRVVPHDECLWVCAGDDGGSAEHRGLADRVVAAEGAGEETEAGVLADDEAEFLGGHIGVGAFFHAERGDA